MYGDWIAELLDENKQLELTLADTCKMRDAALAQVERLQSRVEALMAESEEVDISFPQGWLGTGPERVKRAMAIIESGQSAIENFRAEQTKQQRTIATVRTELEGAEASHKRAVQERDIAHVENARLRATLDAEQAKSKAFWDAATEATIFGTPGVSNMASALRHVIAESSRSQRDRDAAVAQIAELKAERLRSTLDAVHEPRFRESCEAVNQERDDYKRRVACSLAILSKDWQFPDSVAPPTAGQLLEMVRITLNTNLKSEP